jgi:hypothetical protein
MSAKIVEITNVFDRRKRTIYDVPDGTSLSSVIEKIKKKLLSY